MYKYIKADQSIPLSAVHPFWRKLDMDEASPRRDDEGPPKDGWPNFCNHVMANVDVERRTAYIPTFMDMLEPKFSKLMEPDVVVTKGRPTKRGTKQIPSWWEKVQKRYTSKKEPDVHPDDVYKPKVVDMCTDDYPYVQDHHMHIHRPVGGSPTGSVNDFP